MLHHFVKASNMPSTYQPHLWDTGSASARNADLSFLVLLSRNKVCKKIPRENHLAVQIIWGEVHLEVENNPGSS